MKRLTGITAGILILGMVATAQGAEDCPGTPWRNSDVNCIEAGLHSRHGTCLPGDRYETLCDDKKGMIKTCQGPKPCQEEEVYRDRHRQRDDRRDNRRYEPCDWDYMYNRPCPRGYINLDCEGACERADDSGRRY